MDRFWCKVNKTDTCWLWTGTKTNEGYGNFTVKGKTEKAHRFSWKCFNGEIPKGLIICHKCDNPPCVNPNHLFIGTHRDNKLDSVYKNRCYRGGSPPHVSGEKHGNSVLTEKDVLEIRKEYAGKYGQGTALAKRYGVDRSAIYLVVTRKNWKHI